MKIFLKFTSSKAPPTYERAILSSKAILEVLATVDIETLVLYTKILKINFIKFKTTEIIIILPPNAPRKLLLDA